MVGNQDRWCEDIFVACPLRDLVPDDHILKRVDRVLDLSWLHKEVSDSYCLDNGRPSIDPEAALRLMLAGYLEGIVHDRKLMRRTQTDIAIRWFAGYRLHERLPDHSSLTRIRQRWGEERFGRIFKRTVGVCVKAGLVDGERVHVDATLIRADVSWESLVEEHVEQVMVEKEDEAESSG
jgi:transposase